MRREDEENELLPSSIPLPSSPPTLLNQPHDPAPSPVSIPAPPSFPHNPPSSPSTLPPHQSSSSQSCCSCHNRPGVGRRASCFTATGQYLNGCECMGRCDHNRCRLDWCKHNLPPPIDTTISQAPRLKARGKGNTQSKPTTSASPSLASSPTAQQQQQQQQQSSNKRNKQKSNSLQTSATVKFPPHGNPRPAPITEIWPWLNLSDNLGLEPTQGNLAESDPHSAANIPHSSSPSSSPQSQPQPEPTTSSSTGALTNHTHPPPSSAERGRTTSTSPP